MRQRNRYPYRETPFAEDGHREADSWVFAICAVGFIVLLALGVF